MKLKLDDCCDFINGGSWTANEYAEKGYPILKVSNFDKDNISYNELSFLNSDSFEKYKRNQLQIYDVVIATVGSHPSLVNSAAGRCISIPKDAEGFLLNQNAVCVKTKDPKIINQRYLGYLCKSQIFQHFIQQRGKGAANQMRIPISGIKDFEFDFPTLLSQDKIASILSSYDDLIENNLKRIKLLEEKAQLTYEEWFVKMRFPGYETAKFDEVTGFPEGWEKVKCFDVMHVLSGGTPKTVIEEYWNGDIEFYTPKDASDSAYTNGTEKKITKIGLQKCNSKLYPKNTVFITARGTIGKINLASHEMAMNQSCYALNGKGDITQQFLYNSIQSIIGSFKSVANGGVFNTIVVDTFKFLPFVLPSKILIDDFTKLVIPIYELCLNIQIQNQLIKEARDILLPRLMSGMIDVEELKTESLKS